MARVELRHVSKRFGEIVAVGDISLDAADGEIIVFVGPSGCGKTTIMRIFAGLTSEGVDAEAVEVRIPSQLDRAALEASPRKTGRAQIVEEVPKTGGLAFSPPLESAYRPDVARIVAAARALGARAKA
jgi:ABC-type glutathione transport system ATPase component